MTLVNIFTGDTVRVKASFYDWVPEGEPGVTLIDPDGEVASVKVFDGDLNLVDEGSATKEAVGVYYYDWTAPAADGVYLLEFSADFDGLPQLSRKSFLAKIRP